MEVLIDELPVEQTSVLKNSLSKPTHYMHINHGAKQLLHAYWFIPIHEPTSVNCLQTHIV